MKSLIFILSIFTSSLSGATTLSEAQKIAVDQSPELKASLAALQADEAILTRSSSRFYPRLGVESRYELFDSTFEMRKGGTQNLFAEWNLFNGFQDVGARRAQRLDVEASRLRYDLAKSQILWEVETIFSKVLAFQESIAIIKSALERNVTSQKAARSRRAAGVVSDADVLEFDLFESILRADLAANEGNLKEAQAQLRTLLGTNEVVFPLVGTIQRYKLASTVESLVALLPDKNVELKATQLGVEKANAELSVARGGFLPTINAFATYGSLGLRESEVNPETYAGIVARWELFSGLDTIGARREALAKIALAEASLKTAQIARKGDVEQIYAQLRALEYRIQLEDKNHETVHKYLRTVSDEYRRGVKNSPDLKTATDNVLQSHLREVRFMSEYLELAGKLRTLTSGAVEFEKLKYESKKEEK